VETGRKKRLLSALFPHRGFARLQRPRSFRSIPPTCPQPRQSRAQSEDCLTLSLWAPKEPLAHAQSKSATPPSTRAPASDGPFGLPASSHHTTCLRTAWGAAAPGPKVQESLVPVMVYLHGGRLEFSARSQDLEESGIFWSNLAASTNQVRDSWGRTRPHPPRSVYARVAPSAFRLLRACRTPERRVQTPPGKLPP
jgi:hypothetical protein